MLQICDFFVMMPFFFRNFAPKPQQKTPVQASPPDGLPSFQWLQWEDEQLWVRDARRTKISREKTEGLGPFLFSPHVFFFFGGGIYTIERANLKNKEISQLVYQMFYQIINVNFHW